MVRCTALRSGVFFVGLLLFGCSPLPDPGPFADRLPEELAAGIPAALRYVVDHATQFAVDERDPLLALAPGIEIDDLAALDGCWGATLLWPGVGNFASFYFLQRFDAPAGTYESWLLNDIAGVALGGGEDGTYVIGPDSRLAETSQSSRGYLPLGEDLEVEVPWDAGAGGWIEPFGPTRTLEYLATLSGDRLRLHFGPAERDAVDPGDELVYVRFDCPQD